MGDELETERLRLRRWRPEDLETLAAWNVNHQLMEHMGRREFTREETDVAFERFQAHWATHGFGVWVAEEKETGALIGRAGISYHRSWPHDPEVGWLIDVPWQGQGLATEAGGACVEVDEEAFGLRLIVHPLDRS